MEQYEDKGVFMNKKPDRSMIYIALSVIFLITAIAVTSVINSRASTQTDVRAKASVQAGVIYEGIVNSIDLATNTFVIESLKPVDNGMILSGIWNVQAPSTVSLSDVSIGVRVQITVDSKSFDIQNHTMSVKKVEVR